MYNRQLPAEKMELFQRGLEENARREPMDATHHIDMQINGTQYRLQLLIRKSKIIPIQAIRVSRDIQNSELITRPMMLGALTEFMVEQYTRK